MAKKITAAVLGVIAAFGIVAAVEALGHTIYPVPPDLDFNDSVAFGKYVQSLPVGALLFPAGAWVLATLGGGLLACFIAKDKPFVYSGIIGGFIFLATVANLMMISHPMWFSISALAAIAIMTYVTGIIASSRVFSSGNNI